MSDAQVAKPLPVTTYVKIPDEGEPYLGGRKCGKCGAVFLDDDERETCGRCFARGEMKPVKLANHGKLYNYTIVHRNFPGIPVPFISAIVDLDGGGTVKGNLNGVPPNPEAIKFDMPVKVVFGDAGRKDKNGNSYLAYTFAPA